MTEKEFKQMELFHASTTWFHVFKSMIDCGDLAKLSGSAIKVYLVVKSYTNFSTAESFPSLDTIAEKCNLSTRQVIRELQSLEECGYVTKKKTGRHNIYTLREKVTINDADNRPTAVATFDYLPSAVRDAVADLKNVLVTGNLDGAKIVHIEKLQVNVTHIHDNGTNFNIQNLMSDFDNLPSELRDKLVNAYSASKKDITED